MDKLKTLLKNAGMPATWLLISTVLGAFGLPPAVTGFVHVLVDVGPQLLDQVATVGASAVTAWTSVQTWRASR